MRSATPDDADGIYDVAGARDLADGGHPEWTPEGVRTVLAAAGDDAFVVTEDGRVAAFGLVRGIDATVTVHPDFAGRGIGSRLRDEVERRARGPVIRQEIASANVAARHLLEQAGYEQEQRYWRMERALAPDESPPSFPAGADPRRLERPRDDHAAYELIAAAMREIPGNTERSFGEWAERALTDSLAPELSTVAGEMAAIALCHRRPGGESYIDYVAVAPDWRNRGLGHALLQESFALFAAEGLRTAALWVNGTNESATRLYRSAGMRVTHSADRLVKRL